MPSPEAAAPPAPGLRQSLTLFDVTMIAIGGTIGSGIFLTPSLIAQALPSPWLILGAWLVGGLMALAGALTFSELAGQMPHAGGQYVYLKEAYGPLVGFLFGWAYFLVVNAGGLGALSVAFATYFGYFVPLGPAGAKAVAIGGLLALTAINVAGVKAGAFFSDVFTVLKLAGIAGLVAVGLTFGSSQTSSGSLSAATLPGGLGAGLAAAMVGVLWSTGGWQHATYASAEIRDARRTLPLAMTLGTAAVTLIYLAVNVAYLFLLTPSEMAASPRVAADAVSRALGPVGGSLISLAIFISTFGVVAIYTLTAPRIYFAMARDGVFFRRVAAVHPRFRTPAFAIVAQSLWAVVLILFWGTFENLISYVVFTDWIFFGLAAAAVFVLRRRQPRAARPVRVPLYPLTPAFFVAMSAWFVAVTLVERPAQAWAGLGLLALGVPAYYSWKRRTV
ncbi:MAG TPA: amino acid permease [Vicinamibacterales bacterium]|nr:amino acid permease [Acidobacteriota bacterium]HOC19513.1 amino acid permease [Vicinamibacterales bacterium]